MEESVEKKSAAIKKERQSELGINDQFIGPIDQLGKKIWIESFNWKIKSRVFSLCFVFSFDFSSSGRVTDQNSLTGATWCETCLAQARGNSRPAESKDNVLCEKWCGWKHEKAKDRALCKDPRQNGYL